MSAAAVVTVGTVAAGCFPGPVLIYLLSTSLILIISCFMYVVISLFD